MKHTEEPNEYTLCNVPECNERAFIIIKDKYPVARCLTHTHELTGELVRRTYATQSAL